MLSSRRDILYYGHTQNTLHLQSLYSKQQNLVIIDSDCQGEGENGHQNSWLNKDPYWTNMGSIKIDDQIIVY